MNKPETGARVANIDVVRSLALVAIVIGHTYTQSDAVDRVVQSWRLPVFFVLTGYFWSAHRSLGEDARRRAKALLVPYVVWLILITALVVARGSGSLINRFRPYAADIALGGSYAGRPYTTFWFFTALFIAVLVYRWLMSAPTAVRLAVVVAGLVMNLLAGPQLALVPYSIGSAMAALIFLEAGRAVRSAQRELPRRTLGLLSAASVTVAAALVWSPSDFLPMVLKNGQVPLLATVAALLICGALVLAATAFRDLPSRVATITTALARPSLVVIVSHPLVLWFLRPQDGRFPLPFIALAAIALPLAFGLLVVRTPAARLLAGVDQTGSLVKSRR